MRTVKAGLVYFLLVFSAGFALALVRIPWLVPAVGARAAELIETSFMLAVIVWAARRLAHQRPHLSRRQRLAAGGLGFACLVAAELAVAWLSGAYSPAEYVASRDRLSGSVYLASLIFFATAPALWSGPDGPAAAGGDTGGSGD